MPQIAYGMKGAGNKGSVPLSLGHLEEALKHTNSEICIDQDNAIEICSSIDTLNLQFRDIGSLQLVWLLSNITHLYINNNKLKKTEGLEHLKDLILLDLSFNQVNNIDDLGGLVNLEVLALHGNRISSLNENVFLGLKKLKVLSLGNNLVKDKKEVLVFGHNEKLGSLTFKENPCTGEDYPSYVIAHLPNLVYLDYERITEEQRKQAFEMFSDSLAAVKIDNARRKEEMRLSIERKEEEERHKSAGVYALNGDTLFEKLFESDEEMRILTAQPGVHALIDRFRERFKGVCLRLFEEGLLHANQRNKELTLLGQAIDEAKQVANEESRKKLKKQEVVLRDILEEAQKNKYENAVGDQTSKNERDDKMLEQKERTEATVEETMSDLLENEVTLVNQIKEVLEKAEDELGGMVSAFLSDTADHFEEGRRHAYTFYCQLRELTTKLVDAALAISENIDSERDEVSVPGSHIPGEHSVDLEINTERRNYKDEIFEGDDTLTEALARIHDSHLEVINKREEEFKTHLTSWLWETLEEFHRLEWRRHRTRLEEIMTYTHEKTKEIAKIFPQESFPLV